MYKVSNSYIKSDMKMSELVLQNPSLLLLMEHFGMNILVQEKTVFQICSLHNVSVKVFLYIANLYNGFHSLEQIEFSKSELADILIYLKNSHNYYENEKYPEIQNLIQQLYAKNNLPEIKLIDKFFNEYFEEVKEHLSYENRIVFPYFQNLLNEKYNEDKIDAEYSVNEYSEHHTDIESKLKDLKELLLKHVPVQSDSQVRRNIIIALFELEHDINLHTLVEERILMPMLKILEGKQ